jgi:hypothetical protein
MRAFKGLRDTLVRPLGILPASRGTRQAPRN